MSFISTLARQVIPGKEGLISLKKIYNEVTDQPFGYLLVDLEQMFFTKKIDLILYLS